MARVKSARQALADNYVGKASKPLTEPLPAYWSSHRDGFNVTAKRKAEIDRALAAAADEALAAAEVPPEEAAAAAAWERLDDMRKEVGKDTAPDLWSVDPERAARQTLMALESDMRDAVEAVSRTRLVEAAAPSHPPFRVLVEALAKHATSNALNAADASKAEDEQGREGKGEGEGEGGGGYGQTVRVVGAGGGRVRIGPEAFAATWNDTLLLPAGRRVTTGEAAALLLEYGVGVDGGDCTHLLLSRSTLRHCSTQVHYTCEAVCVVSNSYRRSRRRMKTGRVEPS